MKAFLIKSLILAFPCVAAAQVATLQIQVIAGDGAVHPPGAHLSRPLTVELTDDTGHPVSGAAVTFQLPAEGPGGLFSNGLRTDLAITGADGRASIHALLLNRDNGQFRIRITAVKEQVRAGAVSTQYIGGSGESSTDAKAPPSGQGTARTTPTAQTTEHSPGITPTTAKMGSGLSKKWIVLGALAVGGGVAFLGASRAGASHGSSNTVSSSVVSIGTPSITVGHP